MVRAFLVALDLQQVLEVLEPCLNPPLSSQEDHRVLQVLAVQVIPEAQVVLQDIEYIR